MKKILLTFALLASSLQGLKAQTVNFDGALNGATTNYALDFTTGFTVEYWVYLNQLQDFNGLVSQANSNIPAPLDVYINGSGLMTVLYGNGTNIFANFNATTNFIAGKWYHIAHTYDPTTFNAKLYVDGILEVNQGGVGTLGNVNTTLYIANRPDGITDANIKMKDFRVWVGEKLPTLSVCSITGTETDLAILYKMDEGTGTVFNDLATADGAQNATLNGIVNWEPTESAAVTISADNATIGVGSVVNFTAITTGSVFNLSYQWYKNNLPVGTNSYIYSTNLLSNQDSVYVVVSSEIPCGTGTTLTSNGIEITVTTFENSLSFDGSDDWVDPGVLLLPSTTNVTVEGWFNYNFFGSTTQCIFYNGNSSIDGYGLYIQNNGLYTLFGGVSMNYIQNLNSGWYHYAMVNDGVSWKVFLNGQLVYDNPNAPAPPTDKTYIGGKGGSEHFSGVMDEVRFWNTARTQAEILQNINCVISTPQSGLVALYNFNDGTPNADNTILTTTTDNSGNAHHATISNFDLFSAYSNFVNSYFNQTFVASAFILPSPNYISTGVTVVFTATPQNGGGNPSYQWFIDGTPVGTNSNTFSTNTLTAGDTVTCMLTSSATCVDSSIISNSLNLIELPPNCIPYWDAPSCYAVGNLEFCNVLFEDPGDYFYNNTTGLSGTNIDDASILSTGQGDAYDGAFELAINNEAFTDVTDGAFVDTVKHVFQTTKQTISGVNVSKQFKMYEQKPIVRFTAQVENPTSSPINVRVDIATDFGSDSDTQLDSSSTGGTSFTNNDRWMITNDNNNGDPIITSVRYGAGAIASQPNFFDVPEGGNEFWGDSIWVSVPANSTRYVVMFSRLDSTSEAAHNNASYFNNLDAMLNDSMFYGIDTLENIVNWSFTQPVSAFAYNSLANGCDSVDVSFTNNSANADMYIWNFGDGSAVDSTTTPSHTFAAGTFTVSLTAVNNNSLDSLTTTVLTLGGGVDVSTTLSNETISAAATGVTYQWLNCGTANSPIAGANSQSYTATANGSYAVIITSGPCSDTSACVSVNTVGLKDATVSNLIKLYPNPAKDAVEVVIKTTVENAQVVVIDMMGKVVASSTLTNQNRTTIDISSIANGIYYVQVISNDRTVYQSKLVKQ